MKKLLLALFLLTSLFLFGACGSDDETHTHSYGTWTTTVEATCTARGQKTRSCACGYQETQPIDTIAHTYGNWSVTKPATCGAKGTQTRTCACGNSQTQDIAPTGEHQYGEWSVTFAPTCGTKGESTRVCACGASEPREIMPTNQHTYGEWSAQIAATCSTGGIEKRLCACGASDSRETQPTGVHAYGDWTQTDAASCTKKGKETRRCSCGATDTRDVAELAHTYGNWSVSSPATCLAQGEEKRTCTCGAVETRSIQPSGHVGIYVEDMSATCQKAGALAHYECKFCGKYFDGIACTNEITDVTPYLLPITTHHYVQGTCDMCGQAIPYTRVENTIYFGSYPQTQVTDTSLIATLNTQAGTLPTSDNAQAWISYGYYIKSEIQHYMWYIDLENGSERYRGVYFTEYRPYYVNQSSILDFSYQDNNGYNTGIVYWFRYEPISWTILSEENNTALIFCNMILDAQAYQTEYFQPLSNNEYFTKWNEAPSGTYANNYAYSTIRSWLNNTFYETAFNDYQKEIILATTLDNSASSTNSSQNKYACENTTDKVFLLSAQDVSNSDYGFRKSSARCKSLTSYAKAMGALPTTLNADEKNGTWWLRSPSQNSSFLANSILIDGSIYGHYSIYHTAIGVVPALCIKLS